MMNKSKIEWCDFSWNPVTGCLHGCPYCYAAKQTKRFSGNVRINKGSEQLHRKNYGSHLLYTLDNPFKNQSGKTIPDPVGFEPIMHSYRLQMPAQKKKPAKIFVCSMADLFGDWVPDEWIEKVFKACDAAPQHNYIFLTKNPERYEKLEREGILRNQPNFWYGSTVTTPETKFFWDGRHNTFLSIEPIHAPFHDATLPGNGLKKNRWIIVGAETGNRSGKIIPERSWIEDIVKACKAAGIPVFLKNSLQDIWGRKLIQEWPETMPQDKGNKIPHCKGCQYHTASERHFDTARGKMFMDHKCTYGLEDKKIPGNAYRSSPEWCQLRDENKGKKE